jgi:AcrR family transcriptional regulator
MEARQKILEAAVRVFAETGYRGATTRRIAQEAGVNEVTLFRQFGSKEELIREAIGCSGLSAETLEERPVLPAEPRHPERELTRWCASHLKRMYEVRSFIRKCMGESAEHIDMCSVASTRQMQVVTELRGYLERLRDMGLASHDFDAHAASGMLMGALFTDAISRDLMPGMYDYPMDEAPRRYVRLLLAAIGVERTRRN